ncbi:PKD domain-containing protein [Marinicellulosiphila megalodicopiae]|uniref:PKD domain-containing protein n=1 Tax=Marinicellulosiphila megalodicopiae TaxID=2724896 RepID=UPI003BAFA866
MLKKICLLSSIALLGACDIIDNTPDDTNIEPVALINIDTQIYLVDDFVGLNGSASFDEDGTIQSFSWKVDNQLVSTSNYHKHQFSEAKKYSIELTVTDNDGAKNTASQMITIEQLPKIVTSQYDSMVMLGSVAVINANLSTDNGSIQSYIWTYNGDVISNDSRLEFTPSALGEFTVSLELIDNLGLSSTQHFIITATADNLPPVAELTSSVETALIDTDILFDASGSTDNEDGTNLTFAWKVDGNLISQTQSQVQLKFMAAGKHTVEVSVTDSSNQTRIAAKSVTITDPQNMAPTVILNTDSVIPEIGDYVNFVASANDVDVGDTLTYQWFVNDVDVNVDLNTFSYQLNNYDAVNVKVVVTDNHNARAEGALMISVPEVTDPTWVVSAPNTAVVNESVSVVVTSVENIESFETLNYQWRVNNQLVTESSNTLTMSFESIGEKNISVLISNSNSLSNTVNHTINVTSTFVNSNPNAVIVAPTQVNQNTQVLFDGSGSSDHDANDSIASYKWWIDGNLIITEFNSQLSHTFVEAGEHKVKLEVTDTHGAVDDVVHTINILPVEDPVAPVAVMKLSNEDISAKMTVTLDGSTSTDMNNDIVKYQWYADDMLIGEQAILDYRFESQGDVVIKLVVTDSQNLSHFVTKEINVTVEVNVPPIAVITLNGQVVTGEIYVTPGEELIFDLDASFDPNTNGGIGDKYWSFGNNAFIRNNTFTQSFTEGTHSLTLTVFDYTGSQGATTLSIVAAYENELPEIVLTGLANKYDINKEIVVADASNSNDPDGANSSLVYQWYYNNMLISSDPMLMFNFSVEGTYDFELTVIDVRGAQVMQSISVEAQDIPETAPVAVINVSAQTGFAPFTTQFDALNSTDVNGNNTIVSYAWSVNGEQISTQSALEYTFEEVGDYELALVVTDATNMSSQTEFTTITAEMLDPNHPEVFTLLEDTGLMSIYKINNCGVSEQPIENSGAILVDQNGTSVTQPGWNHITASNSRFADITANNYNMYTNVSSPSTGCASALTNANILVKRYSDWHNQHANGLDYSVLNNIQFGDIHSFVIDLYISSQNTEYLTPQQLMDIYGPDSSIAFPLTQAEVQDMDVGHLNVAFEIAKGDGPGAKVALANLSIDPKYMDQWIRIEMPYENMWLFEKDQNYIPVDRTAAQLANESVDEVKMVAETQSTDVYRNYRQNEIHAAEGITANDDMPNTYPKNYKIIDLKIKRMEIILKP